MATLVLSTVGSALGGPIGGAIGALLGQSIDQQILGPKSRGPRLGDLSVQTSSYGTQIPRVYGTMRVAGSVVWATDLVESSTTSGAKGQPGETYSYSVSFAVALSSRPAMAVKRIWADGKLLRGEAGDFKVNCDFRFHGGTEEQAVDPLIASIEGMAETPAYRGIALAVFENLELGEYGNRIPFLTFELCADTADPALGLILDDASNGRIAADAETAVGGYAAFGRSIRAAVEPLVETFTVPLFDDGTKLRSPKDVQHSVSQDDLGSAADGERVPRIERERTPAREAPARLTLSYYDPDRDYQAGLASTEALDAAGIEAQIEMPAVLSAAQARSLAEECIARRWAGRDRLTVRLGPNSIALKPGETVNLEGSPVTWQIEKCTVEAMTLIAELRPAWRAASALQADPGRSLPGSDLIRGPVTLALLDIPDLNAMQATQPFLTLAAGTASGAWKSDVVEVSSNGFSTTVRTAAAKSVIGSALNGLAISQSSLIDTESVLEVQLLDPEQWLTSCDDEALIQGANFAVVGQELLQFGEVSALGDGRFQLRRLLRARLGTEWAMGLHGAGETFVLIDRSTLASFTLPGWLKGAEVAATQQRPSGGSQAADSTILSCEGLRPPSPVQLAASVDSNGNLVASWTRRSRQGWAWLDDVDVPLGEQAEKYSVSIDGTAGRFEAETTAPAISVSTEQLDAAGSGPATLTIRQIGDWAVSHPAPLTITLP